VVVPIYCLVSASDSAEPITYVKYHITGADKVQCVCVCMYVCVCVCIIYVKYHITGADKVHPTLDTQMMKRHHRHTANHSLPSQQ
jgi:hypothetical protein